MSLISLVDKFKSLYCFKLCVLCNEYPIGQADVGGEGDVTLELILKLHELGGLGPRVPSFSVLRIWS